MPAAPGAMSVDDDIQNAETIAGSAELPTAAVSIGGRIGPYDVRGILGRGGMGTVVLGRHAGDGHEAAVKIVHAQEPRVVAAVRREIRALAALHHPGIVRILSEGEEGGVPWYAMEILRGGPLSTGHDGDGGSGERPSIVEAITLVRRLCEPVAFLHGEGVVHRDLKPGNAVVVDGWPKLVDFGLATRFAQREAREILDVTVGVSGTALYMAPEQARGELVDARADIYALGCILHELVAGRPPFEGSVGELLDRHMNEPAAPLRELRADVPEELERLVAWTLEKEPSRRLGHASVLARALVRLGACDDLPPGLPAPRSYVFRPELAGREQELARLVEAAAEARQGKGGAVLLGGEGGSGKTRLALELGRRAMERGTEVLTGEGRPEDARPLAAMRPLLRALADRCRGRAAETARTFGSALPLLAGYEPALAALPGAASEAEAEPGDPADPESRQRAVGAMADVLARLAGRKGALVLIEDVQWADDLTLEVLEVLHARGRLAPTTLLLLGTYRTEEPGTALARLRGAPGVLELLLPPLSADAVARLVGGMLAADSPPPEVVEAASEGADGNPFFVAEYLRHMVTTGALLLDAREGRWRLDVAALDLGAAPQTIQEVARRRLRALSPVAADIAGAVAVVGREATWAELDAVLGGEPDPGGIRELAARQVLQVTEGGLRLLHDQLRGAATELLEPERRRQLHERAAEGLERGSPRDDDALVLGRHWERAGRPERAVPWFLRALDGRRVVMSQRLRKEAADALIALAPRGSPAHLKGLLATGTSLGIEGRHGEAHALLEQTLATCRERGLVDLEARTLRCLAEVAWWSGDAERAWQLALEAESAARRSGMEKERFWALVLLGRLALSRGDVDRARVLLEEALAVAGVGSPHRTFVQGYLAVVARHEGRPDEARALYEEVIARCTAWGLTCASALANLAVLELGCGDYARAIEGFVRSQEHAIRSGDLQLFGSVSLNLGVTLVWTGRSAEARLRLGEAMPHLGRAAPTSLALRLIGQSFLHEGRRDEGVAALAAATSVAFRAKHPASAAHAISELARLHLHEGLLERTSRELRRATELMGSDALAAAYVNVARARLALAEGRPAEARSLADEAHGTSHGDPSIGLEARLLAAIATVGTAGNDAPPGDAEIESVVASALAASEAHAANVRVAATRSELEQAWAARRDARAS